MATKKTKTKKTKTRKKPASKKVKEYDAFVEFLSLPEPDRCAMLDIPYDHKKRTFLKRPTMELFGKKYKVNKNTLTAWKKSPETMSLVEAKQIEWGLDRVPNVMAALYNNVLKKGTSAEVETFLAYYKGWNKKQVVNVIDDRFDADDIRAIAGALPEGEQDEFLKKVADGIAKAQTQRFLED